MMKRGMIAAGILGVLVTAGLYFYVSRDKTKFRLEQAAIAMANGKAEQAIQFADAELEDDPRNVAALRIKAGAELKLNRLDAAGTTLQTILSVQPDLVKEREQLVTWTFLKLDNLLGRPQFAEDKALQDEFDRTLELGFAQAEWFRDQSPSSEDDRFLLARYLLADVYRLERMGTAPAVIDKRLARAESILKAVVAEPSPKTAASYLLAKTLFRLGKVDEAAAILQPLSLKEANSLQVRKLYARCLLDQNDLARATIELVRLTELAPADAEVLEMLAEQYEAANDRKAMRELANKLEGFRPQPEYQLVLAKARLFLDDPEDRAATQAILKTLHEMQPTNPQVDLLRGRYYLQGQRYAMAAELFGVMVAADPKNIQAERFYRMAMQALGWSEETRSGVEEPAVSLKDIPADEANQIAYDLQLAIRSQPENPIGYRRLSRFYFERNRIVEGLDAFNALYTVNEGLARTGQAWLMHLAGRNQKAEEFLKPVYARLIAERDRNALPAADTWAEILIAQKRVPEATMVYERLIEAGWLADEAKLRLYDLSPTKERLDELIAMADPDQPKVMYEVLRRLEKSNRLEGTLTILTRWTRARPEQGILYRWRGNVLRQAERPDEAIDAYRRAVTLDAEDAEAWEGLAGAYIARYNFCGAEEAYETMAGVDADLAKRGFANLAKLYAKIGLPTRSASILTELARRGHSPDPAVLLTMGETHLLLDQREQAERILNGLPIASDAYATGQQLLASKSNATQPAMKGVAVSTAYLEAQKMIYAGRITEAIAALRAIYENTGPCRWSAGNDLAYLLAEYEPERLDEACQIARTVYAQGYRPPQLLDTLGWIEHLRGNDTAALELLNRAVIRSPSQPGIREHLRAVYRSSGNAKWAGYYDEE